MNKNHTAFQLWENGQLNEAIQLLFEEIEANNDNSDSYCNLASILILAKKYEDAQVVLETALEKYPNHIELLYTLGNFYYQTNKPLQAIEYFKQVFNGNIDNLKNDATIMIGQSYMLLNEPKKALIYLLTAYENNIDDSLIMTLLGDCMMQTSHFREAKHYFMKVLKLESENDEVFFKLGLVGAALKEQPEKFNVFFEKSKQINPEKYQERLHRLEDIETFISNQTEKPLSENEISDRKDG